LSGRTTGTDNPGTTGAGGELSRPPYDIEAWRRHIPLLETTIPMNACSHSPQSLSTSAAAELFLASWDRAGMDWEAWMAEVDAARAEFASLVNASPSEIAVVSSVSAATNIIASALDFTGVRNTVVASEAEFPTVGHVWLAQETRGASVRWVPVRDGVVPPDEYASAIDERTRVVSACHGYYQTGFTQDVASIARQAHALGALIYVDAYQTLGTRSVDVKALDVDFLACGALKYLMGIPGIAFLYVRQELIEQLEPTVTGWFGRSDPFAFDVRRLDWSPTARRFEAGTPPILSAYIARAGMQMIRDVGTEKIGEWTRALSRHLIEGGRNRGLELFGTDDSSRKTPLTAFAVADAQAVEVRMRARGVLGSARGPAMRLAPHFYTTLEDCDRALDVLVDCLA
jgi:selenocysteine lyase/cysteine desulfurase